MRASGHIRVSGDALQPSSSGDTGLQNKFLPLELSPTGANPKQKVSRDCAATQWQKGHNTCQHMDPSEVMTASEELGTEPVNNQSMSAQHRQGHEFCLYSKGMSHKNDRHRTITPSHLQRPQE